MPSCASCNAEIPSGVRWCSICHANGIDASVGCLASPGKRLWAYFLDVAVQITAFILILAARAAAGGQKAGGALGALLGFGLFLGYVTWALPLFARGTTPGKHLLGMRAVKENGQAAGFGTMLFREWIGKFISGLLFALGYIWILIDKDRQGLTRQAREHGTGCRR